MREGSRDNRRSRALNPVKRTLEPPEQGAAKQGYSCLSKADRGRPREQISDPMGFDEGPWHALTYPDL